MAFSDDFVPLSPRNFFNLEVEVPRVDWQARATSRTHPLKKTAFVLPLTTELAEEEDFASVAMGWAPEGLLFLVSYDQPFERSLYPDLQHGDSVELFIDTRDVKTAGFNTRFCHHFFFLPQQIEGVDRGECTHFRTEDAHELCDPTELGLKRLSEHDLEIRIPKQCLTGYSPEDFRRLGLNYRLNRFSGPSQHFAVSGKEFPVEQQPSLWASGSLLP